MKHEDRLLAVFSKNANIELAVAELGRIGVHRDDISIAAQDEKRLHAIAERTGINARGDVELLSAAPPARERAIRQRLASGDVLLAVPLVNEDVVRVVHQRGGDFSAVDDDQPGDASHYRTVVPLRAETADVQVYPVVESFVEVHREIVTERVTYTVPLQRETLVIVTRDPQSGAQQEQRIPLRHEDVRLQKSTVVDSVVEVRRERVEERRTVSVELRRERPVIRGDARFARALEEQA